MRRIFVAEKTFLVISINLVTFFNLPNKYETSTNMFPVLLTNSPKITITIEFKRS